MPGEELPDRRTNCPARKNDQMSGETQLKISGEWSSVNSLKMSSDSMKCPAKNLRFAGQNVRRVAKSFREACRGVETVSPVGHGHLRSDSSTVLSDQMSERTPKYLKCYFGYISACIGPTVKYDLWNRIRTLQTVHICIYLGDLGPFCTWKFIQKVPCNFLVWLRTDKLLCLPVRMTGFPKWVFNISEPVLDPPFCWWYCLPALKRCERGFVFWDCRGKSIDVITSLLKRLHWLDLRLTSIRCNMFCLVRCTSDWWSLLE